MLVTLILPLYVTKRLGLQNGEFFAARIELKAGTTRNKSSELGDQLQFLFLIFEQK